MTKVRGGKGFDALFSRFFDEPGLKSAVDSLHDNFTSPEADIPEDTTAAPVAAKKQTAAPVAPQSAPPPAPKKQVVTQAAPTATKKNVVAQAVARKQVAAAKPHVNHKTAAPKKETEPDGQEQPQVLEPDQLEELEALSSNLTTGWSIELLEHLDEESETEPKNDSSGERSIDRQPVIDVEEPSLEDAVKDMQEEDPSLPEDAPTSDTLTAASAEEPEAVVDPVTIEQPLPVVAVNYTKELEIEPIDDLSSGESTDQLPVIDILKDAVNEAQDDEDLEDRQFEDFFSRKSVVSHAPVPTEEPAPVAYSAAVHETVAIPVVHSVTMHETVVAPAVPAAVVRETVFTPVATSAAALVAAPATAVREVVAPAVPAAAVREVVAPVVPATALRETVVAPVLTEEPASVSPVKSIDNDDDDDLNIDDFFSRKGKSPLAPAAAVREAVAPVVPDTALRETVVAPVLIEEPVPVSPVKSIDNDDDDDDDLNIEDFFSRKGKSPVAPAAKVHAPAVAPFERQKPTLATITASVAKQTHAVTPPPVVKSAHTVREEATLSQKATRSVEKPLYQPLVHPHFQYEDLSTQAKRRPLTKDQGRILVYLYEVAHGCSNVETIRRELAIDSHTVRESLLVLVTEGYLYLLDKKRDSRFNPAGFSYKMNNYLCSRYASRARRGGWDQSQDQPSDASVWRAKGSSAGQPTTQPGIFTSSATKEKVTPAVQKENVAPAVLKENVAPAVLKVKEAPVAAALVGAYWAKEGLEDSLALKWCSTFGVKPEQMHQQLEWARFDLETNKRRENIKKDMISWFYDRLMITGGAYLRPANYRTAEELRAETMPHQQEIDLSAQAKIVEIEFENSLRAFLADPEAPLYRELLAQVNSFALEHLKAGEASAEEIGLDALFKLHWGATSNDPANTSVSFTLSGLGAGQPDKPLSLVAGWNLVGCIAHSDAVRNAISPIAQLIESIWGWKDGEWLSYVPNRQVNSLTAFEPGMGYWIKMKQPASWTMP